MHADLYVYMYVCLYVCMYVCMYIYVCMYVWRKLSSQFVAGISFDKASPCNKDLSLPKVNVKFENHDGDEDYLKSDYIIMTK